MSRLAMGCVTGLLLCFSLSSCDTKKVEDRKLYGGLCWGGCGTFGCPPCPDVGVPTPPIAAPAVVFLGEIGHPKLRKPVRIAAAPNGNIVVSDSIGRSVHIFSANGNYKHRIHQVIHPLGVAVGPDGKIFVGDSKTKSVRIFDGTGNYLGAFGKGNGEFLMPNDIAIDEVNNTIYVVESKAKRVRAFNSKGTYLFSVGGPGTGGGQFTQPMGIAFYPPQKQIIVGDFSRTEILVFDWTGTYSSVFGGGSKFTRPQGMAVDDKGRLYVADAFQGRLQVTDLIGRHIAYVGQAGKRKGQMLVPLDVAIDGYNRLLVTSYDTGKVLIYGIDRYTLPPPDKLRATVVLEPATINTASAGKWVTVYVEVPQKNAKGILLATAKLQVGDVHLQPVSRSAALGDHDQDKIADVAIKFGRADLIAAAPATNDSPRVRFSAKLDSGELIEGWTVVRLIRKKKRGQR